jgi:general secretion pathway protein B
VPAYYDLPFATRKALPQLSMSMHVYTADPKQRFVILDGARMVEGDTTTDRVTLREIRPDGVILEFQGQRFFLPRDGL